MDGHSDLPGLAAAGHALENELRRMLLRVAAANERISEYAPPMSPEERTRRVDEVMAIARKLRDDAPERGSSDHGWLYGEDGLPR